MIIQHKYILPVVAMCIAVIASNILVQYPVHWFGLGELLTYGAFTYPLAFLVNDLTNRRYGPKVARHVVYVGFAIGVFISIVAATPRIAAAAGLAFLCGQLCDIFVFTPLRRLAWWRAPLAAAFCGSVIDTIIFFSIAFAPSFAFIDQWVHMADSSLYEYVSHFGHQFPLWTSLAFGDFCVKIIMALFMLGPYGAILYIFAPKIYNATNEIKI